MGGRGRNLIAGTAPYRGSRTCRSRHVRRAQGTGPAASRHRPTRGNASELPKDRAGQPECHRNSCLGRASQLEKAKREYSTFKGVNSSAVYFFKKAFDFEQTARTCSGSGGGREEEVQTRSKSLYSTSADAKLNLFSLYLSTALLH